MFPTNDLKYTGREASPDTGLYYYRARYYDPSLGRFISEDPMGFTAGMDFYVYGNDDPVNVNDPS
ncbi:MAG: RHS repeat-associated core domain-containing protein, partial [Gammaproteobacteria bacterium]